MPFAYDAEAGQPLEWLRFLRSVWPDDRECIEALQEWAGYLLTSDTRQQKIMMLVGPKRSGKGTIARVLRSLVGQRNTASPTLAGIATNFGMQPLIGKTLATINDARLSGRTDAAPVVERLLSVSGEDGQTIDRKHLTAWEGKLPTRFMILTNELPRLDDASGAIASRMLVLRMTHSWFGKEDAHLFDRLVAELPAIFVWAVEGWLRLAQQGRFTEPRSGAEMVRQLEDLASPVKVFVSDRCVIGPEQEVSKDSLFEEWQAWCKKNGHKQTSREEFFRSLQAAYPFIKASNPLRREGKRVRLSFGIGLKRVGARLAKVG
jgi:putative DNA primase/helicase